MKILLIAPSTGKWRQVGKGHFWHGRTFRFSMLSLLTVAAETPAEHDVRIVDEQMEPVPWDADVDLVGITGMTAVAPRGYEIAAHFRARGIPVVMGGIHATLCPTEALEHADAVVAGDAEGIWQMILSDVESGNLSGIYRNPAPPDLADLKPLPRHLLDRRGYVTVHAVQATRGCPYACDFCSVSAFHHRSHRRRPAQEVAAEVAQIPDPFFIFVDDNLTAHKAYARELFQALAPLNKKWVTQSSLTVCQDEAFLDAAADAGCCGFFVGMETFSEQNLKGMHKGFNKVEEYRGAVDRLHQRGITVEAGIVFGFDGDGPEVFETTLAGLEALQVDLIQASILTPLPGTPLGLSMADRVFDRDWSHYDFHHAVFEPAGMTAAELKAGHDWVTRSFYHPKRIAQRLAQHTRRPRALSTLKYLAGVNLAYYGRIRQWNIRGHNPAKSQPALTAWPQKVAAASSRSPAARSAALQASLFENNL